MRFVSRRRAFRRVNKDAMVPLELCKVDFRDPTDVERYERLMERARECVPSGMHVEPLTQQERRDQ